MSRFIVTLFSVFSFFLPFSGGNAEASRTISETGTEIGRYAPPLELTDLLGNNVSLESLKGFVVLLNFSSVVCAPCMAEMPSLNRLQTALSNKGLQIVSVAIDPSDSPIREYATKYNISFTVLLDQKRKVFLDKYECPRLPASYLIDKNGVIVEKFSGLQLWDGPEMKSRILMLLEKN
jgi:peroxiredoxin